MMNFTKTVLYVIACLILLNSCAIVYKNPNINAYKEKHRTIAVLPYSVSLANAKLPKGMTVENRKELELIEGKLLQKEVYEYLLEKKEKKKIQANFQPITTTDSLLKAAGITQEKIKAYKAEELAKALGGRRSNGCEA